MGVGIGISSRSERLRGGCPRLAKVRYVDAKFMLPVTSYAAFYRLNQIDFSLIEPNDDAICRMFKNTNWAHFIDPVKYPMNERRRSNNLPAVQFQIGEAQNNVVNQAMEILLETIRIKDRTQLKALEWALNEITDNVLNHTESAIGGLLQIQCFPTRNLVAFHVVDAGLGIPHLAQKDTCDHK